MKRFNFKCIPVLAASLLLPVAAMAQTFPTHAITLIVPFAAGGGTDSIARDMARSISEKLGQPVVVENRGGGGGSIGANVVAKAKPDGYTLLFATSTFVTNAAAELSTSYDVEKSFAPIAMIGRGPLLVVASPQSGIQSIADLQKAAKASDGALNFCSAGAGSINHLAGERFAQKAGVKMTHIPYKGSGPATIDLLAGRVEVFFATVPTILTQVTDRRVNLLAVTSATRSPLFPDTPTMAEAGIADFDVTTWWGVLAPAATPPAVIAKLNTAINEAASDPLVRNRLTHEGADPINAAPDYFAQNLSRELALWRGVVKQSGMQLNQ